MKCGSACVCVCVCVCVPPHALCIPLNALLSSPRSYSGMSLFIWKACEERTQFQLLTYLCRLGEGRRGGGSNLIAFRAAIGVARLIH